MEDKKLKNIFENKTVPLFAINNSARKIDEIVLVFVKFYEGKIFYKVKPKYQDDSKSFWVTENEIYEDEDLLLKIYFLKFFDLAI